MAVTRRVGTGNATGLRKELFRVLPAVIATTARARYLGSRQGRQLGRRLIRQPMQ
jgi:hypothetical protein